MVTLIKTNQNKLIDLLRQLVRSCFGCLREKSFHALHTKQYTRADIVYRENPQVDFENQCEIQGDGRHQINSRS